MKKVSFKLIKLCLQESFDLTVKSFEKLGIDENGVKYIEVMIENPNKGKNFAEPDFLPQQMILELEDYLINEFNTSLLNYKKEVNDKIEEVEENHRVLTNLLNAYYSDLLEIIDLYDEVSFLDEYSKLKSTIKKELIELKKKYEEIQIPELDIENPEHKILLDLTKKEVCVLFDYLFKRDLILGVDNTEQLGKLIERHFMYKALLGSSSIINAKNTLSKIYNDDSHKTTSKKLESILKDYK